MAGLNAQPVAWRSLGSWSGAWDTLSTNILLPLIQGIAMGLGSNLMYYTWTWWMCRPQPKALPPTRTL